MNALQSILPVSRKTHEELRAELDRTRKSLARRNFAGAQINRLTQDFSTQWNGINQDLRTQGYALLARARGLAQNNSVAKRYLQLYITNVIGALGHTFQPNVNDLVFENVEGKLKPKSVPDVIANMKILDGWRDWILPGNCSKTGRHTFADVSKLIGMSRARDGECFIRLLKDSKGAHPLKLEILAPEAVDHTYNTRLQGDHIVVNGVELDGWRRPVAYHIRKPQPEYELYGPMSFSGADRERVPAENIIHWFRQEYHSQTRGVTDFAQVMTDLYDMSRYQKAVVVNATVSAAKMGFFSDKEGESEELTGDSTDADGNIVMEAEAGSFNDIGSKELHTWDPKFPTQQYEMYIRGIIRQIAAGLGVAYSSLANDYSSANYSSLRAELLVERANWKSEQQSFIDSVLRPIFARWLELEILAGNIILPFSKFSKFNNPVFIGPRWPWVDPRVDVVATRMEVESGWESPFSVVAEKGESSLEQIYQDIEEAQDLARQHKIKVNYGGSAKPPLEPVDAPTPKKEDPANPEEVDDEEERHSGVDLAGALVGSNGNGKH